MTLDLVWVPTNTPLQLLLYLVIFLLMTQPQLFPPSDLFMCLFQTFSQRFLDYPDSACRRKTDSECSDRTLINPKNWFQSVWVPGVSQASKRSDEESKTCSGLPVIKELCFLRLCKNSHTHGEFFRSAEVWYKMVKSHCDINVWHEPPFVHLFPHIALSTSALSR